MPQLQIASDDPNDHVPYFDLAPFLRRKCESLKVHSTRVKMAIPERAACRGEIIAAYRSVKPNLSTTIIEVY